MKITIEGTEEEIRRVLDRIGETREAQPFVPQVPYYVPTMPHDWTTPTQPWWRWSEIICETTNRPSMTITPYSGATNV